MNVYKNGNGWDGKQGPLEYSRQVRERRLEGMRVSNPLRNRPRHNGPRHVSEVIAEFVENYDEIIAGNGPSKEQSMNDLDFMETFAGDKS